MQQTRVRLFLQQTYNRLTTNLQQTYDRLTTDLQQTYDRLWNRVVIELSKYIMTDLRQL